MSTKTIPLAEAKAPEMRAFAKTHLGITFKFGVSAQEMRAQIMAAWDKPDIVVEEVEAEAAPAPVARQKFPTAAKVAADPLPARIGAPRKRSILVARSNESGGDQPVPVAVNGRAMLIPRGERVEVPESYVKVLEHAIEYRYDERDLGNGQKEMVRREVPAYPFQDFGPVG